MNRPDRGQESATALSPEPSPGVEIRELRSTDEFRACVALQKDVWGRDFTEVVPSSLLKVTREVEGIVAGAFSDGGELVGFVYGLSGVREGHPSHWSHMLGVRASHRGGGVGFRLKQFQRARLLAGGIREMRWTFDPLVAGNAHFNLNLLGTGVEAYLEDAYGDTGSGIHSLGTDRLVARWELDAPEAGLSERAGGDPVRWRSVAPFDPRRPVNAEEVDRTRIAVPADVLTLKRDDPEAAREWRLATREAFQAAFRAGYRVVGFQRVSGGDGLCHYLLRRSLGN